MLPSAQPQQPHIVSGPPQTLTHLTARKHSGEQGSRPHAPAEDDVVADGMAEGTAEGVAVGGALATVTGALDAVTEGTASFVDAGWRQPTMARTRIQ